ncbi:MAG: response regulator [Burkholderiales bacterium]|nr:response regulator [Burkholderiales bacterium]
MRNDELTINIIDDDPSIRDSLALMLGLSGYRVALFADAESFLAAWQPDWRGCVVTDLRLPGLTGTDVQEELARRGSTMGVIIITAHGDVATARRAFRAEAVDFLEKPFEHAELVRAIDQACARDAARQTQGGDALMQERLASLTQREREVLGHVARGLHAKEIARSLGISPRTVEVHKARLMAKLEVRNVAELVRLAVQSGLDAG